MDRRIALRSLVLGFIAAAALLISLTTPRTHHPAFGGVQLSSLQTADDPGDYALATSGDLPISGSGNGSNGDSGSSLKGIAYGKLAVTGPAPNSNAADGASIIVLRYVGPVPPGTPAPPQASAPSGPGGLAWTGEAVFATLVIALLFTGLGIGLILLARRRRGYDQGSVTTA